MIRTSFLLGASALALVGAPASAQTTDTTDAQGNRAVVDCPVVNTCTVTNGGAGATQNFGSARVRNGTNNRLTVEQTGNRQTGTLAADGSNNSSTIRQSGNSNSASVTQTGTVATGFANVGEAFQGNNDNSATITQARTDTGTITNFSQINQARRDDTGGFVASDLARNNTARSSQNGSNLYSFIIQNDIGGSGLSADSNSATVTQVGLGSRSNLFQGGRSDVATVYMGGGGENVTTAPTRLSQNQSFVRQQNNRIGSNGAGGFTDTATTGAIAGNNRVDIAIIGLQNSSQVDQNGVNNSATISMLGGGVGNTNQGGAQAAGLPTNRREGNTSNVLQVGRGNVYAISTGGRSNANPDGAKGNSAAVTQGNLGAAPSSVSNAVNMRATIYQRGIGDTVSITQNNNANGIGGAIQSGSTADVSQLSRGSSVLINQSGTNVADVTQGLNADNVTGGQLRLSITQNDLGDTSASSTGGDPFGTGASTTPATARANTVAVSQSGTANTGSIFQNTVFGRSTLFQARGSSGNRAEASQGAGQGNSSTNTATGDNGAVTAADSFNLQSDISQSGQGHLARVYQDGRNNTGQVTQSSTDPSSNDSNVGEIYQARSWHIATISQNGQGLRAAISQSGASGTSANPTRASITQTGEGNRGDIVQSSTSGASDAGAPRAGIAGNSQFPNARPAGAASAEAFIIQSMSGNSAFIQQDARGAYARIEQSGSNNYGEIAQGSGATNSVAILEQSGNGNSLRIEQGEAGQYIRVVQTGSNNAVTSTTEFSNSGGGGGTVSDPNALVAVNPNL